MFVFKNYNAVTDELQRRYNIYYNARGVRNTSTSRLLQYIQQHRLTDSLEVLERLGYSQEQSVVVLASVQTLQQLGGVA